MTHGVNMTVYSQTFNLYGNPASGWDVNYNLSLISHGKNVHIASGFAGITNNSGMLRYNLTGVFNFNMYLLSETISNHDGNWANYSLTIVSFLTVSPKINIIFNKY